MMSQLGFRAGDAVRVLEGPYRGFVGAIEELPTNAGGSALVRLPVFGRRTVLELSLVLKEIR